jgi:hypothetical protein
VLHYFFATLSRQIKILIAPTPGRRYISHCVSPNLPGPLRLGIFCVLKKS